MRARQPTRKTIIPSLDSLSNYIKDIARAVAFLSRLRVPSRVFEGYDGNLGRIARAFPFAGLLISLPSALLFGLLATAGADPLLTAFLTLCLLTVTTGALHEDGLSDSADGLGGGRDKGRTLTIMKDSRIGTYGAIALILSFGLRAAALAAIIRGLPPLAAALTLPAAAAISRAALVWHWHHLPAAKTDGVAAEAGQPDRQANMASMAAGIILAALLLLPRLPIFVVFDTLALAAIATWAFTTYVRRKLAGHTGDTIGATQQICEITIFCGLALAV